VIVADLWTLKLLNLTEPRTDLLATAARCRLEVIDPTLVVLISPLAVRYAVYAIVASTSEGRTHQRVA
jgi:hypothetical protein